MCGTRCDPGHARVGQEWADMKTRRGAINQDDASLEERLPESTNVALVAPTHCGRLLGDLLLDRGAVTAEQIATALLRQDERGGRIGEILVEQGAISERTLTEAVAEQFGLKVVDLRRFIPESDAIA